MNYSMIETDQWSKQSLKYEFQDQSLLVLALTHRSVSSVNNERLEFLGDSILGFVIADLVYQLKQEIDEGNLTRLRAHLVQESTLHKIAVTMNLSDYIILGSGEKKSGVKYRPSVLSDTLEALIGAVYIDGGYQQTRELIKRLMNSKKRPLLKNENGLKENINTIYSKRKSIYNKAHFKIDCNNINEKKITNNIVKLFYEI